MIADSRTSVAFTGHRTYRGAAADALRRTVGELYALGFRTFMSGMAVGFDLAAAEAIAREGRADVHVHLYGKRESRPLRKMGHITFVGLSGGQFAAEWAARFE